jgi:hypothetical protein
LFLRWAIVFSDRRIPVVIDACGSIFCLFRYRDMGQRFVSFLFLLLSVAGVVEMPYVLPGWKM